MGGIECKYNIGRDLPAVSAVNGRATISKRLRVVLIFSRISSAAGGVIFIFLCMLVVDFYKGGEEVARGFV